MSIKVGEAQRVQFCEDWMAGLPTRMIAQKYGLSDSGPGQTAKRFGLPGRKSGRRASVCFSEDLGLRDGRWEIDRRRRILVWQPGAVA